MHIEDYVKNYNYTFLDREFNIIDNLVLSQLSYLKLDGIINKNDYLMLKDVYKKYVEMHSSEEIKKLSIGQRKTFNLFELLSTSKRYSDAILSNYVNVVDEFEQFGALTIKLNDNSKYISFEGSDGSIIGWRENFILLCEYPTKTQQSATNYLNNVVNILDKNIRVGGHSKGGNLAMVAYMECHLWIKNKIIHVYNNDGPGLRKEEYNSNKYKKMEELLTMIVPENSIVGMLMLNTKHHLVVETSSFGFYSHSIFTWKCFNKNLNLSTLSKTSIRLNKVIISWLEKLNSEQKYKLIETFTALFEKDRLTSRFNLDNILEMVKGIKTIDKETKSALLEILSVLKECLKDNLSIKNKNID